MNENVTQFPDINQIKDEAALWVVKIQRQTYKTGQGIPERQAEALKAWLAQSDLHRECFQKMLSGWDAMGMLEELAGILPLTESPLFVQEQEAQSRWLGRLGQLLAEKKQAFVFTCTATVLSMALIWGVLLVSQPHTYTTGVGEQATYTLDDGSILTLNTNSEIEVDYSDTRRTVTLYRGEVNFDVAKNKQRPFVVHAGDGMVWAVGTAFNIDYRGNYVDVVVSEGTVKVFSGVSRKALPPLIADSSKVDSANNAKEILLDAGESVQYADAIVIKEVLKKNSLDKKLAWQSGVLHFDGETLEVVMGEISRYTHQQLVIIDPSIRETRVGGRFKTDDIDTLLSSLTQSLDIKMEEGEGERLLFSAK